MNIAEEPGWADVGSARFPSCELRKQGSTHSSGKGVRAASSGDCRPVKRARRDAVTRVWEWLDVTVAGGSSAAAAAAAASPATAEVAFLGGLHLSDGSAGTTAVTAALDTPPCEAVEPCVSSLLDERNTGGPAPGAGRDEAGCVSSRLAPGQPQEGASAEPAGTARIRPGGALQGGPSAGMRKMGSWQELLPPPRPDDGGSSGSLPGVREWRAQELGVRRSTSLGDAGSTHGIEQQMPPVGAQPETAPQPLRKQLSAPRKRKLHCDCQEEQPGAQGDFAAAVQDLQHGGDAAAAADPGHAFAGGM